MNDKVIVTTAVVASDLVGRRVRIKYETHDRFDVEGPIHAVGVCAGGLCLLVEQTLEDRSFYPHGTLQECPMAGAYCVELIG